VIAALLWALDGLLLAFAIYSIFIEPRRLRLVRRTVHLPDLPPELDGLRLAHLADLHVKSARRRFPQEMARRAVALAVSLEADLVCVTGDLGQASRHVGVAAPLLTPLTDRPAFAVMGNHDHDKMMESEFTGPPEVRLGAAEWRRTVEGAGLRTLVNENATIELRGRRLALIGVGDPSCGWDDLGRALGHDAAPADFRLVLVHSPDLLDDPRTDQADLVLCGHTHGGQIRLPGIGTPWAPVWRDRRRSDGLFAVGETVCHVTRGVSAGIPARFLCRPEVCELTLRRGAPTNLRRLPRYALPPPTPPPGK
jgi:predicted MPP superfamily phosphohydrolase